MLSRLVSYLQDRHQEITDFWIVKMGESNGDGYETSVSGQIFQSTAKEFIQLTIAHISDDQPSSLSIHHFFEKVFHMGWTLDLVTTGLITFKTIINEWLEKEEFTKDEQLVFFHALDEKLLSLYKNTVIKYTETWERTVSLQKTALRELSAPLIPVFEGISVMPLIGTIDTDRAKQIMETLLYGVVKYRSEVVLIDITGVPVVDTMVAHHLLKVADAISLVGSKCMLVGIRPEIAQTIINIGINLDHVLTNNTLQKGMEQALELTNRKIVRLEGSE